MKIDVVVLRDASRYELITGIRPVVAVAVVCVRPVLRVPTGSDDGRSCPSCSMLKGVKIDNGFSSRYFSRR